MSDDLKKLDYDIISWLFESRAATADQLGRFSDSEVVHRLELLVRHNLIRKRELLLGGEVVYSLSRIGCDTGVDAGVISSGGLSPKQLWRRLEVSDMTLLHELEVVDVRLAFERAVSRSADVISCALSTYFPMRKFETEIGKRIYPDGLLSIAIESNQESLEFCVEIDRGTETTRRIARKVSDYLSYKKARQPDSFRVLFIVPSVERRNNIAWLLLKEFPKVPNFCLVANHSDVISDPFGQIFLTPASLRDVSRLDQFAPTLGKRDIPYRRSLDRDTIIGAEARFIRIID